MTTVEKRSKIRKLIKIGKILFWILVVLIGIFWVIVFPVNLLSNQSRILSVETARLNIQIDKVKLGCSNFAKNSVAAWKQKNKKDLSVNEEAQYLTTFYNNCVVAEGMPFLGANFKNVLAELQQAKAQQGMMGTNLGQAELKPEVQVMDNSKTETEVKEENK